jgi:hypothetical protein
MYHEPIKRSFFIIDVLFNILNWRARHYTTALVVGVAGSINESVVASEQLPGPIPPLDPHTSLTTEICGTRDDFSIYH